MDTFRKWLNKPKADDKSLLARFYHADRALTAVASELDSFDGRAEPDRCSRLVSRLRQGQDKVLSITNQIMDELLGEDRSPRAFRAKFPEEVLQENLAGQLWFGAECLAAGSSIMNRETESTAMRPLAKAVTKSLDNVRNLLRDQCLRNNIPNSPTLRLDINDASTEQLYESLKIFDRLFAEFELRYVSAMVQVKSKQEYEMQELICVLFSETLQRALRIGLLEQDQVDAFDPALMFSIPRLAIISGLVIYSRGPLNIEMPADQLSEMFRPFRTILVKIRDLLRTLNKNELFQLERLLCTNEEIHLKAICTGSGSSKANDCDDVSEDDDKTKTDDGLASRNHLLENNMNCETPGGETNSYEVFTGIYSVVTNSLGSSPAASSSMSDVSSAEWTDDSHTSDMKEIKENLVTADCASGFLIPNTTFGNLLQPTEAPLTDNLVSDDEYDGAVDNKNDEIPSHVAGIVEETRNNNNEHSESETNTEHRTALTNEAHCESNHNENEQMSSKEKRADNWVLKSVYNKVKPGSSKMDTTTDSSEESEQQTIKANSRSSIEGEYVAGTSNDNGNSISGKHSNCHQQQRRHHHSYSHHRNHSKRRTKPHVDISSGDTSSSTLDAAPHEVTLALRAAGRIKFKSTENLLHRLFVCIAGVADQLQTNFASDLRRILRSVFLMNTSQPQDEIKISEKSKDSDDLFEFRASENDVIQENAGSNQSIYSAEEVDPELDNVFGVDRTITTAMQRGSSLEVKTRSNRNNISRSRSLGEESSENDHLNYGTMRANSLQKRHSSQSRSSGSNSPESSASSSGNNSPVGRTSSVSLCSISAVASDNTNTSSSIQSAPPWIPDVDAPRCMSCTIPFTAFRRRHHCRNCGGVFCGGCSNCSASLPKYGLVKAVRVCRECFVREVATN